MNLLIIDSPKLHASQLAIESISISSSHCNLPSLGSHSGKLVLTPEGVHFEPFLDSHKQSKNACNRINRVGKVGVPNVLQVSATKPRPCHRP